MKRAPFWGVEILLCWAQLAVGFELSTYAQITEQMYGEYMIVRDTTAGPIGYPVHVIRGEDGIWRIDGL